MKKFHSMLSLFFHSMLALNKKEEEDLSSYDKLDEENKRVSEDSR